MQTDKVHYLPHLTMCDAMRLFGLTARAIRLYEEKGLVEARRNHLNARYFDAVGRKRLGWIACLRAGGVSLRDICDVLSAEDEAGQGRARAVALLQRRCDDVQAELDRVQATLRSIAGEETQQAPGRREATAAL